MEFYENRQSAERVLLISVDTGEFDAEESMSELAELVKTAGGEAVLDLIQKLPSPNPATYIGSGRMSEVGESCKNYNIDLNLIPLFLLFLFLIKLYLFLL